MTITRFVPTLNEINGVKAMMPRVRREWVDEIIVVAAHSTDGTPEWFREHGYRVTGFGNWMFTTMVNVLYGAKLTDVLVACRAFRRSLAQELDLSRSQHPFFEQELVIRAVKHRLNIVEVPGDEPKRIGGVRKMSIVYNGFWVLCGILRELFVHRIPKH